MKYSFLSPVLAVFILISFSSPLFAFNVKESTRADINYQIENDGTLVGSYKHIISNDTDAPVVLTSYNFSVPVTDFEKDTLLINSTPHKYSKHSKNSYTDIFISLSSEAIGSKSEMVIDFQFEIPNYITSLDNEVFSLRLPIGSTDILNKTVNFVYPKETLPELNWASIGNYEDKSNKNSYRYTFENVSLPYLSLTLGSASAYNFSISKLLINGGDVTTQFHITVPGWTNTQYSTFSKVSPIPDNVSIDSLGNIQFTYIVKAELSTKVDIQGSVIKTDQQIPLSNSDFSSIGYWSINDDVEISRVKLYLQNNGVDKTTYENLQAVSPDQRAKFYKLIYAYTLERLDPLDLSNNPYGAIRSGATLALNHKEESSPDDYADLLVALYRLFDVPARTVSGYIPSSSGYSDNSVYHTWVQFWSTDSGNWVSVDPIIEELHNVNMFGFVENDRISIIVRESDPLRPKISYLSSDELTVKSSENISDANPQINLEVISDPQPIYSLNLNSKVNLNLGGNVPVTVKDIQILDSEQKELKLTTLNVYQALAPDNNYSLLIAWDRELIPKGDHSVVLLVEDPYGQTQRYVKSFQSETIYPIWWYPMVFLMISTTVSAIIYGVSNLRQKK